MKEEEWEKLTNCEKLRCRICDLDVSESTSNNLAFELANIEDEISDLQEENEELKTENEKLTQLWLNSQGKRRKAIECLKKLNRGVCYQNGVPKPSLTYLLNFDDAREVVWETLDILQGEDTNVNIAN